MMETWGTYKDVRTGPQKPLGPCPPELQLLPLLQGAASLFMNIHDINILEIQILEKLRQLYCRCDAAGSLRPSSSPQDPAGCGVMGGAGSGKTAAFCLFLCPLVAL